MMNPRKEAGPLGTADLPAPVEIPETVTRPEEKARNLLWRSHGWNCRAVWMATDTRR